MASTDPGTNTNLRDGRTGAVAGLGTVNGAPSSEESMTVRSWWMAAPATPGHPRSEPSLRALPRLRRLGPGFASTSNCVASATDVAPKTRGTTSRWDGDRGSSSDERSFSTTRLPPWNKRGPGCAASPTRTIQSALMRNHLTMCAWVDGNDAVCWGCHSCATCAMSLDNLSTSE